MKVRTWWRRLRCESDRHRYERTHRAVWSGGYYTCRDCGRREVLGGDAYGPCAGSWKAWGTEPPTMTDPDWALTWSADDWKKWLDNNRRVR